jgi:NAD kinase
MQYENAIIVVNKTRLELLIERFNTKAQARFFIERSGGNFIEYELEHNNFKKALEVVQKVISKHLTMKVLDRTYVSSFIFSEKDLIIVLGQDGLVANTAKYSKGIPILAINPDPERYDGILLPFNPGNFESALRNLLNEVPEIKSVTMAEVHLNDGQKLVAFNDFFIGPKTHISARYQLTYAGASEIQSSSGIIVSTGAGSTGWLSSLFNMANSMHSAFSEMHQKNNIGFQLSWDTRKLAFVVREPFQSIYTGVDITAGLITESEFLKIESLMPTNGQIFSDGIETDFLNFNSGAIAEIGIAKEKANIVIG